MEWRELTEDEPLDGEERLYARKGMYRWDFTVTSNSNWMLARGYTHVADITPPDHKGETNA